MSEEVADLLQFNAKAWLRTHGKDGPPTLWFVHRERKRLVARLVDLPEGLWRLAEEPRNLLVAIADHLSNHAEIREYILKAQNLDTFVGALFIHGAWLLETLGNTPADLARRDQLAAFTRQHRISEHPDRIEVVMALFCGSGGTHGLACFNTDGSQRSLLTSNPDEAAADGVVFNAVNDIVTIIDRVRDIGMA